MSPGNYKDHLNNPIGHYKYLNKITFLEVHSLLHLHQGFYIELIENYCSALRYKLTMPY